MDADLQFPSAEAAADEKKQAGWSRLGIMSIALPCVAYGLTILPHLGMKSMMIFHFFATWTRLAGACAGVLLGIITCVQARSWPRAKVGFLGIALGLAAFATAFLLAPKHG